MSPECVLIIALAVAAATPSGVVRAFLAKICRDGEAGENNRITFNKGERLS
jgi:hypothetical protein